jgi:hypothetical protein
VVSLGLRSSRVSSGVGWLLVFEVSGPHIGSIFKGQAVQEGYGLAFKDGTDKMSRNVGN